MMVIVVTTVTLTRINLTFLSENMEESKGEANLTYLVVIVSVACLTLLLVVFLIAFFLR
jgi:hypothetical protein